MIRMRNVTSVMSKMEEGMYGVKLSNLYYKRVQTNNFKSGKNV